jgi:AcrR family transcriptional regulator
MKKPMQEHILEVASSLFQTRGINATGVDTIVAEADIAKMTLYKYFRTKEELILAVLRQADEEMRSWIAKRLAQPNVKPSEKLLKFVDAMEEWINAPDFSGLPFQKASSEFPQAENPIHRFSAEISAGFRAYVAELAAESGAKDPQALAMQLSMLIEGAAMTEQIARGSGAAASARKAAATLIASATGKPIR